jgi:predicted short-subunit dehydrogenase-like oxidoreductase (DUF2520 family)
MKSKIESRKATDERGEGDESRSVSPSTRAASRSRRPSSPHESPRSSKRAISVAVIGAGRLGTALARSLGACGYDVRSLVSRSAAHARRAAAGAGVKSLALGFNQLEKMPEVALVFITTPDDAIEATAERLAALPHPSARVVLHASGALSSELLAPLRKRGASVGSMHPLVAVSDAAEAGAQSLRGAFYCVEGDRAAVRMARRVVRDLGGESFTVESSDKPLYHAAAVLTAGHVVALFDVALDTLRRCGLKERRAREVLLPLLRSAVENLSTQPPARALTGSLARTDVETVRKHLRALRGLDNSDALAVYKILGLHSLALAVRAGANPLLAEKIRRLTLNFYERDERGDE